MADKPNAGMEEFWNGEGGRNWVSREDRLEASLKIFGQQAINTAGIVENNRILDIGFGCGETSIDLARLVGSGGHVHGVDISTTMVDTAQKKAKKDGVGNISFECADAQTSALAHGEYDIVFSRFGVMFFDDPVTAFKNIYAGLKPTGRIAFMCWAGRQENSWVRLPLQVVAKHLDLPPPPAPDAPGPFSLSDENRVTGILAEAGFSDITVEMFRTPFVLGGDLAEAVSFLMELSPSGGAIKQAEANEELRAAIAVDMADMLKSHSSERGVSMDAAALIVTANKA